MFKLKIASAILSLLLVVSPAFSQDDPDADTQSNENVKTYTTDDGKKITVTTKGTRVITVIEEKDKTTTIETVNGKTVRTSTTTRSSSTSSTASRVESTQDKVKTEDDAFIAAKVGYGYFRWNISPLQRKIKGDQSSYDFSTDPFLVKRFDLNVSLFFINAGAEYLTDNIREWGGFDREDQTSTETNSKQTKAVKQLSAFGGITIFDTTLRSDIVLRQFNSHMTSRGVLVYSYPTYTRYPVYYYNMNGDAILLPAGSELQWNSLYQQYNIRLISRLGKYYTSEYGFQYVIYDAPTEFNITARDATSLPPVLIHTRISSYYFIAGLRGKSYIGNYFYIQTYFPLTIAATKFTNPCLSTRYGYSVSTNFNVSLNFATSFLHCEAGIDGSYTSLMSYAIGDTKVKQDMTITSNSGTTVTLKKGSYVSYTAMRDDLFWGLYAKVGLFF